MCKENINCKITEHIFQPEYSGCWRACLAMMTGRHYADPVLVTMGGAILLEEGLDNSKRFT